MSAPDSLEQQKVGPNVLNQVITAATGWGHVARCGCGWKSVHETKIAALVSGQRHVRNEHGDTPTKQLTLDDAA